MYIWWYADKSILTSRLKALKAIFLFPGSAFSRNADKQRDTARLNKLNPNRWHPSDFLTAHHVPAAKLDQQPVKSRPRRQLSGHFIFAVLKKLAMPFVGLHCKFRIGSGAGSVFEFDDVAVLNVR